MILSLKPARRKPSPVLKWAGDERAGQAQWPLGDFFTSPDIKKRLH